MDEYSEIIQKAKELSDLINSHEITLKYRESLEKLHDDAASQRLLADLVRIGRELSESMNSPEADKPYGAAELDMLKKELDANLFLKDHLVIQRQYLDLIAQVQKRIKNPAM
ncbi:MAG TPA: YlbF family regulator [Spirochaetota bacterium]|nr:YlbF family regulator [Spirochaetota bacterium]